MKFISEYEKNLFPVPWCVAVTAAALVSIIMCMTPPEVGADAIQQQPGAINMGEQDGQQNIGVDGGMNVQPEGDTGPAQGGQINQGEQAYEQPQDLADIPGAEDMFAFDPETIPDSVFPEDADWAFNIPINVTNLPPQVEKLGITCETLYWHSGGQIRDGRWNNAGQERNRVDCGYAKRRIDVADGGYVGNIVIGVQMTPGAADNIGHAYWLAREYECKMYLVGDLPGENNSWEIPQTSPISPFWRRADANEPFRWWTGRQPIPDAAKPNPPWADAEGDGGIVDAAGAVGGAAGQASDDGAGDAQDQAPGGLPPMNQLPNQ